MSGLRFEITDDSGFMALVDPAGYRSFVGADWTLNQLVRRFKEEMGNRRLVIWGTGREDCWRVEVCFHRSDFQGFREFCCQLRASTDRLALTNFESLSMAAQFADVSIPEAHQLDLLIPVIPGNYQCRIVQSFDPESTMTPVQNTTADFLIELTPLADGVSAAETFSLIPWTSL
jgi:hypothetical protein